MINLLPYKEKKSIEKVRFIKMLQAIVIALLALVITSFILLIPVWITTISRLTIGNVQIKTLENEGKINTGLDLVSTENRANFVKSKLSTNQKSSPTDFIELIRKMAPAGVNISRYTTEDGVLLEVFGVSQNRELLQYFIKTLEANEKVSLVDNPVSNFIKNKNGTFKLTISFK